MKDSGNPAVYILNLSYTGLGIARSLSKSNSNIFGIGSKKRIPGNYSKHVNFLLAPDSQEKPEDLCNFLMDHGRRQKVRSILFPTRDHDVIFLKEYQNILENRFILPQPDAAIIDNVMDKWALFNAARACRIQSPETFLIESLEQALQIASEIPFPAVLKPVMAADWRKKGIWEAVGRKKTIVVKNKDDLLNEYKRFHHLQSRVLVQQFIDGDDCDIFTFCSYRDKAGKIAAWFNTQKIVQQPPQLGTGIVVKGVLKPELETPSRNLLEHLQFKGISEIEYKRDPRNGEYYLIEINPRFWDQHRLSLCSGLDLPLIVYKDLMDVPYTRLQTHFQPKTWVAEHSFFFIFLGELRYGFRKAAVLMKTVAGKREYAIWDAYDPVPFIAATIKMALTLFKTLIHVFIKKIKKRG